MPVHFEKFSFGFIQIDGIAYDYDLVIDRGEVRKRKKKVSKQYRDAYGHTPVSVEENIPWRCRRLLVGTGAQGRLPVIPEVHKDAQLRKVELVILPTKTPSPSSIVAIYMRTPYSTLPAELTSA